jgi:hypothetical protein
MAKGDYLEQGTVSAYIESVNQAAGTVEIEAEQTWVLSTADVTHLKAIDCEVEWNPDFANNPAGLKMFYEANILLKQDFQREFITTFFSDVNQGIKLITLTGSAGNGSWGEFIWGDVVWGGETGRTPKRVGIPRAMSRCNQLSFGITSKVVYSDFLLNGVSLSYNPISTRTAR